MNNLRHSSVSSELNGRFTDLNAALTSFVNELKAVYGISISWSVSVAFDLAMFCLSVGGAKYL